MDINKEIDSFVTRISNIIANEMAEEITKIVDDLSPKVQEQADLLQKGIATLPFSVRALNILETYHITSLGELLRYPPSELIKFRNMGKKTVKEIESILQQNGLHLGMFP